MTTPPAQKVFVKANDTATIRCPECDSTRKVEVGGYRFKQHTLKVRCSCSHCYLISLDFRKNFRKKTDLPGNYLIDPPVGGNGPIQVTNISKTGVGFTVAGIHNFQVGLEANLEFTLDNRLQSQLNKKVIVRSVNGDYIGSEFADHQDFEKELGFYLRSH
ncbi:MAG: hypothetical protein ABFS19_02745 [Thermodesulfobacteriota bacterium]